MIRPATLLRRAREKRKWTHYRAAQSMRGVKPWTLVMLESNSAKVGYMRLATAVELVRAYWPDVTLDGLMGEETLLRFTPSRAGRSPAQHARAQRRY